MIVAGFQVKEIQGSNDIEITGKALTATRTFLVDSENALPFAKKMKGFTGIYGDLVITDFPESHPQFPNALYVTRVRVRPDSKSKSYIGDDNVIKYARNFVEVTYSIEQAQRNDEDRDPNFEVYYTESLDFSTEAMVIPGESLVYADPLEDENPGEPIRDDNVMAEAARPAFLGDGTVPVGVADFADVSDEPGHEVIVSLERPDPATFIAQAEEIDLSGENWGWAPDPGEWVWMGQRDEPDGKPVGPPGPNDAVVVPGFPKNKDKEDERLDTEPTAPDTVKLIGSIDLTISIPNMPRYSRWAIFQMLGKVNSNWFMDYPPEHVLFMGAQTRTEVDTGGGVRKSLELKFNIREINWNKVFWPTRNRLSKDGGYWIYAKPKPYQTIDMYWAVRHVFFGV